MTRRNYSSTAQATTLSAGCTNVATTMLVTAVTGWPASTPYTLIVDPDTVNEEVVTVTSRAGTTLTVTRAVGGTSGVAHSSGAVVRHGTYSADYDEPNSFLNLGGTIGGAVTVTGGVTATTGAFSGAVSGTTGAFTSTVTGPLGAVGTPGYTFTGDTNTGLYSPTADNIALATGGVQRLNIDSAGLFTGTGSSMGAWTAYTPTLGGFTAGNGTAAGAYCKTGKKVEFRASFTFGTTSAAAISTPSLTLPVTAVAAFAGVFKGLFVNGGNYWDGFTIQDTTGACQVGTSGGTNGAQGAISTTVPFTWTTGSVIRLFGTYEAA